MGTLGDPIIIECSPAIPLRELGTIRITTQHDYRRKRNLNQNFKAKNGYALRGSGSIAALQDLGGLCRENCGVSRFQRLEYAR